MVIKKEKISFQALQKNDKLNKKTSWKTKKEKYSTTKILKFKLKN